MMKWHAFLALAVAAVMVGLGSAAEPEVEFAAVSGSITVDGEPLPRGRIFFHLKEGQFVGCRTTDDGTFKIDRAPVGPYPVTIEGTVNGKPLPDRYSSDENPQMRIAVRAGENVFDFNLSSR